MAAVASIVPVILVVYMLTPGARRTFRRWERRGRGACRAPACRPYRRSQPGSGSSSPRHRVISSVATRP